ncbi:7-dehydrocholesterol reductase [Aphelenchoides besseyi]|nr:7-dehydrocholesterol reductase [Aphelenchoides besseyi]KAI6202283.1 7-dehydrocholesterol reductase [Aphelenchoides besseyi]
MLRQNRRRSSSNGCAVFVNRRSSITLKDIAYIENIINKTKKISTQIILLVIIGMPIFIHIYYTLTYEYKGNLWKMISAFKWRRLLPKIRSPLAWIFAYGSLPLQFIFFWLLPANERHLRNESGVSYRQRWNAFSACLLQMLIYSLGACLRFYRADVLMELWSGVMFANLTLCVLIQGYLFYMNNDENTESESLIRDFYFGQQRQPIVLDMDVKAFLTNRIMCSLWASYLIAAFAKQRILFEQTTPGFVVVATLQFFYIARRLFLDPCSPDSLDNQNDKAGFYRLWGVLVLLSTLYLTPITLISQTDTTPSVLVCVFIFLSGLIAQLFTSAVDAQKMEFRKENGNVKFNGKDPFYIVAKFRKETGEGATNLLIGSGFWGVARHLNYTGEILSFTLWTLPLQMQSVAYFPLLFLILLLWNRISSDELRCLLKYHQNWIQYTNKVPYRLLPSIY